MTSTQLPTNDTSATDRLSIETSPSRQQALGPATNFILGGNRQSKLSRSLQSSRQLDNPYTTNSMVARQDEQYTGQEVEFLKHLASDFAGLLNRVDISDCFLRVRGNRLSRDLFLSLISDRSIVLQGFIWLYINVFLLLVRMHLLV